MSAGRMPPKDLMDQLRPLADEILGHARAFGLDPYPTVFEVVEYDEMNQIAAYAGFPTRYPHWRFGMEYEELRKSYTFGLSKIYELVINNEPCYAYLMRSNALTDQKMVMAHVFGHSDFFRNNLWFGQTNRTMINDMANHGTRIRRAIERHGQDRVERFIDCALSLENLIDYHSVHSPDRRRGPSALAPEEEAVAVVRKLPSKGYMDRYINPPEFLDAQRRRIEREAARKKGFPERPEKDVLYFLMEYAPLESWQRDVLSIVREEAYYFAPQALTKIMNEGWAAYWHSKLMTERILSDEELIHYAEHHAGVLGGAAGPLNPYKLGLELFKDIEERWNTGRFGRDYDECDDLEKRAAWDRKLGLGREKIFEVRRVCNDITFIDTYLTPEFCERRKLFVYKLNPQTNQYEINTREFDQIKRTLLFRLTNMGSPVIRVVDANYKNRAELLLKHDHEGFDLEVAEARDTLVNLQAIWQRPVHLLTIVNETPKVLSYNGEEHAEVETQEAPPKAA
jgi:stage V sporulation protein R